MRRVGRAAGVRGDAVIRALVACTLVLALGACDLQRRVVVKPVPVEVVRYVQASIDPALTAPIVVREPDALCWLDVRVFCNGQLQTMLDDYRAAVRQCNADRSALREPADGE